MRVYKLTLVVSLALCLWIVVNVGLSMFADGTMFYTAVSPMPYVKQTPTHVTFKSWYWVWMPMTISSSKLLECDGRITSFAPVEALLPSGVGLNDYEWRIPPGATGECAIHFTVTYSPFGALGAKMSAPSKTESFVLP